MTMHNDWTDKLSDYLDDELSETERAAVEAHLRACAECSAVLNDLRRVIARAEAAAAAARPPQMDLWTGVAGRIERVRQPRRVSLTVAQLAAAAVLLIAVSAGISWRLYSTLAGKTDGPRYDSAAANVDPAAGSNPSPPAPSADFPVRPDGISLIGVSLADDQYDAAVADLERALKQGRGKLDKATIAVV